MRIRAAILSAFVLPLVACAQDPAPQAAPAAADVAPAAARPVTPGTPVAAGDPRIALAARIPGARPEDLRATPVPGIFELSHGSDISYITADAGFVFSGDLYKVASSGEFPNLTEERRRQLRLEKLANVPESQMLVFGPDNAAHTITVFTDIDCPWCRKMHSEIADYNKLGLRVRYMFFPRGGPETDAWIKAETVWCSTDRNSAFTSAKKGRNLEPRTCAGAPVAMEYQLGQQIGITGTPGIVLENGELVPGYLGPRDMLAHIQESASKAAASKAAGK